MRAPEITTALEYVRNGVEGSCLVDYKHKATISWTLDTLAGEVERLEAHLKGAMQDGGYEHFTAQLRNAQKQAHNAIYVAQQLEKKVAELEALDELTTNQAKEYLARAEAAEARVRELEAQNARLRGDLEYAEAERLRLTARRDTLDTQIAALTEKTTRLKEVLVDCHAYLMRRITLLTLNESASDTTQSLAREVSVALDALDDGKAAP